MSEEALQSAGKLGGSDMPTKYDDASWHYGGDFPKHLPPAAGATHIGMYLAWAIVSGLESDFLREELAAEHLVWLKERKITPGEFLIDVCDEKFVDDELDAEGKEFTDTYYASNMYFDDYDKAVGTNVETLYDVPDTWETFDKLKPVLDRRFDEWKRGELNVPNKKA
jgi:hypothetical protein